MLRFVSLVASVAVLAGCSSPSRDDAERRHTGTVQKVMHVARQADGLSVLERLEGFGKLLNSALRRRPETNQYVIRTADGQISAQSDEDFTVGQCVEVVPASDQASGPAFRYGEARIVGSDGCGG
jgi:hypothetical protein